MMELQFVKCGYAGSSALRSSFVVRNAVLIVLRA